jgi:hypothetical protein
VHAADRIAQPLLFMLGIVGDNVLHDDARLIKHDGAERKPPAQRDARHLIGFFTRSKTGIQFKPRQQTARDDQFRQDHRDGLEDIDDLGPVAARQFILYDQDTAHAAAP